jgi:hypothetical protein
MHGRLPLAARSLTIGAVFLAAAAIFHLLATPHIAAILRKMLDAKAYGFLQPILSFVFVLNVILLAAPVAHHVHQRRWRASRRAMGVVDRVINALTILALPCTILATMGVHYFARSTTVHRRCTLGHRGRSLHALRDTAGAQRLDLIAVIL